MPNEARIKFTSIVYGHRGASAALSRNDSPADCERPARQCPDPLFPRTLLVRRRLPLLSFEGTFIRWRSDGRGLRSRTGAQ